jgi:hypothetical protein
MTTTLDLSTIPPRLVTEDGTEIRLGNVTEIVLKLPKPVKTPVLASTATVPALVYAAR